MGGGGRDEVRERERGCERDKREREPRQRDLRPQKGGIKEKGRWQARM